MAEEQNNIESDEAIAPDRIALKVAKLLLKRLLDLEQAKKAQEPESKENAE